MAPDPRRVEPSESSPNHEPPATQAEILLGTTMWLARVHDWLAEVIDATPAPGGGRPETIALRRTDLEAFRTGLGQAVSILDRLPIDPAQVRTDERATPAAPRTLQ